MDSYDTFINSSIYNDTLLKIIEKTNIKISQIYDKNDKKEDIKEVSKSNLTIDEIKYFMDKNYDEAIKFICEKIYYYKNKYEKENDNIIVCEKCGNKIIRKESCVDEISYYLRSFIIFYIIELHFIKNNPDKLLEYLMDINMDSGPYYNEIYEKELKEIYNKIKCTH